MASVQCSPQRRIFPSVGTVAFGPIAPLQRSKRDMRNISMLMLSSIEVWEGGNKRKEQQKKKRREYLLRFVGRKILAACYVPYVDGLFLTLFR